VTRILTKGGKSSAMNNLKQIKRLQEHANDKIQLIIGGDVNDDNYQDIHHQTGATRFHGRKLAYKYN
jgi:copper homeostasis protein